MHYCDENLVDRLDDIEYFKKLGMKVNNYVNPYIICNNTNFNWLI